MSWLWVLYGVGAVIAYVLTVRSFLRSAGKAKRALINEEHSRLSTATEYYQRRYDGELRGLILVPPLVAAVWPLMLCALATEKVVEGSTKLLDKVVDLTMKEPDQ